MYMKNEELAKKIKLLSDEFLRKVMRLRAEHDKKIKKILSDVDQKKIERVRNKLTKI